MNANTSSGQEASESVDEQRARWEGTNFAMTVCANGVVNVQNQNYNESGHIYSVRVEDGHAVGCSCPHAVHRGAHCKHQQAVENSPLVVSSATAARATYAPVATDGGTVETRETTHCRLCDTPTDPENTTDGELCFLCMARCERNSPWTSRVKDSDAGNPHTRSYRDKTETNGVPEL